VSKTLLEMGVIMVYLCGPIVRGERKKKRGGQRERVIDRCYAADFEDRGRGHEPRHAGKCILP
jgi:hypothetical protein